MDCEAQIHSFSDRTGIAPPDCITGPRASADLAKDLERALENHQLVIYFQAISDVRTVVADGVESLAQAKILEDLGCDLLQGDLFGRPRPADGLGLDRGPHEQNRSHLG